MVGFFIRGRMGRMAKPHATIWEPAPELAIPEGPAFLAHSSCLWLAYETIAEPRGHIYAVIRFDQLIDHRFSPINDEGLGEHPYVRAGLKPYAFNEITNSSEAIRWQVLSAHHWVITFKDNTLDVVAEKAEIVTPGIESNDPLSALLSAIN
jgi:hypothetical protein